MPAADPASLTEVGLVGAEHYPRGSRATRKDNGIGDSCARHGRQTFEDSRRPTSGLSSQPRSGRCPIVTGTGPPSAPGLGAWPRTGPPWEWSPSGLGRAAMAPLLVRACSP